MSDRSGGLALYATVVVLSVVGVAFELVAGAASTYLLADSVTQYSLVIGAYLSAMGVGAFASEPIEERVAERFAGALLAASLAGGLTAPLLYLAFATTNHVRVVLLVLVAATGLFAGSALPLLLRVLRRRSTLRELVSTVLALDYLGALLGSLAFSLWLLPSLGAMRTGTLFGIVGALAALLATKLFESLMEPAAVRRRAAVVLAVLGAAFFAAEPLARVADEALLGRAPALVRQSRYQRIVLTEQRGGMSLFLDGNLQFSSTDEYRYHEALVHPAMAEATRRGRVLVLGGGDGLAVREILRYPDVESVTLVDLDDAVVSLARGVPYLSSLNERALDSPKVRVVHDDAFVWLAERPPSERFDVAIVDFPDPNHFALGKLYTTRFYRLLRAVLASGARVAVQSTSPLVARQSFWCVVHTLQAAGFSTLPYHALVPSFGEWGYVLAAEAPIAAPKSAPPGLRYLTGATMAHLFELAPDMAEVPAEVNRLNNQVLVRYYEAEWSRWSR